MTVRWRGVFVVAGGVLVHLTLGTIYTFGNLTPYLTSYIRIYSSPSTLTYTESVWIYALACMGQGTSMFIGGLLMRKLGPRISTLIGGWTMSLGVILTYFSVKASFGVCMVTYGLMSGLGVGVAYAVPMACGMKWLPEKKGLVNGFVVAGFGGGAFIFDQVQTHFINPDNYSPDKTDHQSKYFSQDSVLQKVPPCFLLLGGCYAAMQLVGSLLLSLPPESQEVSLDVNYTALYKAQKSRDRGEERTPLTQSDSEELDGGNSLPGASATSLNTPPAQAAWEPPSLLPGEMLKTRGFYTLYGIFLLNGLGITFISTLYKAYGQSFILDDEFMAWVGAFAAVFNAVGRIMWGHMADRLTFRLSMMVLCGCFAALMLTLGMTSLVGKPLFFLWVCLLFLTFSGNFSMLPTATAKAFGQAYYPINYGLLFTSQVVVAPIGALLTSKLQTVIGWYGMFFLVSATSMLSCGLAFSFNVKNQEGKDI